MIKIPPYRPRHRKKREAQTTPPPPPLLLTAAVYDPMSSTIVLSFDGAIDLTNFDPTQVEVLDGLNNQARFTGISWTQLGSGDVRVELDQNENYTGPDNLLNATADTGIVDIDDGATWNGASNLVLPFP